MHGNTLFEHGKPTTNQVIPKNRPTPKIAVLILNWNGREIISQCLDSLKNVSHPHFDVIIVDNNSSDGSQEYLSSHYPYVHVIYNKENLGFPEGNNVGIRWALKEGYEYVLLLNYDTTVEPDFLEKLIVVAESNPALGIVGPRIRYFSQPSKVWSNGGYLDSRTGRPFHITNHQENGFGEKARGVDWISGCALLVKKGVIEKIGLLDPDYFFGTEDTDWCIRAKKAGFEIALVPDSVVYHKTAVTRFKEKYTHIHHYYNLRNLLIFIEKHGSFSFHFHISFLFSIAKRVFWSMLMLDYKSIRALWYSIVDFRRKRYGRSTLISKP
jgi:hypothetical protein